MIKQLQDLTVKDIVTVCGERNMDCYGAIRTSKCPFYLEEYQMCICDMLSGYPKYLSDKSLEKEVKIDEYA